MDLFMRLYVQLMCIFVHFLAIKYQSINQLYSLVIAQRRHMALNILDNSSSGARLTKT